MFPARRARWVIRDLGGLVPTAVAGRIRGNDGASAGRRGDKIWILKRYGKIEVVNDNICSYRMIYPPSLFGPIASYTSTASAIPLFSFSFFFFDCRPFIHMLYQYYFVHFPVIFCLMATILVRLALVEQDLRYPILFSPCLPLSHPLLLQVSSFAYSGFFSFFFFSNEFRLIPWTQIKAMKGPEQNYSIIMSKYIIFYRDGCCFYRRFRFRFHFHTLKVSQYLLPSSHSLQVHLQPRILSHPT